MGALQEIRGVNKSLHLHYISYTSKASIPKLRFDRTENPSYEVIETALNFHIALGFRFCT